MKYSQLFIQTFKEIPNDAQLISHQLLHRAGFILKSGSGLYNYSPLMMKVIDKTKAIIKSELEYIGSVEIAMTFTTPAELWQESNRWDELGHLMVKFQDRMNRQLCLSPTNEEAVVDYFRKIAKSYKQLPVCLFQINTKFRDEIRPRFGLMRAREFLMKDAYSFHKDNNCLNGFYNQMYSAYSAIFNRMGLDVMAVEADAGAMAQAGSKTHEFQALAESGEDQLVVCREESLAMNIEMASTKRHHTTFHYSDKAIEFVLTPQTSTIEAVCKLLNVRATQTLKAVMLVGKRDQDTVYACALCLGDDDISITKCATALNITCCDQASSLDCDKLGVVPGFIGPIGLPEEIEILYDQQIDVEASYIAGANQLNKHIQNVIPKRDIKHNLIADIRQTKTTDTTYNGNKLEFLKGIEVGHIFQLGSKYTESMKASVLDQQGRPFFAPMGCYGIGVGRAIAAVVEQKSDEKGIVWPEAIAPFSVVILPLLMKEIACVEFAEQLFETCKKHHIDVVLDDRVISPGVKFKDADLIGFPHQIIIGKMFKTEQKVEYSCRYQDKKELVKDTDVLAYILQLLNKDG